ncbi:hypothetical protein AB0D38_11370, partial [Streptomyces sp. NPDC048279]|uniref:hypothetical protein n=1 Tax=Streptomyces sp. NPDC048279 TaxID=3154714 RepID=UPI0034456713
MEGQKGYVVLPCTVPNRIPASRAQAVFQYFRSTPSAGFGPPRGDFEKPLTGAAAAAEGAESVGWLIRFLPGGGLDTMRLPQAHHRA